MQLLTRVLFCNMTSGSTVCSIYDKDARGLWAKNAGEYFCCILCNLLHNVFISFVYSRLMSALSATLRTPKSSISLNTKNRPIKIKCDVYLSLYIYELESSLQLVYPMLNIFSSCFSPLTNNLTLYAQNINSELSQYLP